MRVLRITLCTVLLVMACAVTALAAEPELCGLRIGMTEEEGKEAALKQGFTVGSREPFDEKNILQYYNGTLFGDKDGVLNCFYQEGKLRVIMVTKTTMMNSCDPKNITAMYKKLLADWSKQYGTRNPVYTTESAYDKQIQHSWNLPDNRLIRMRYTDDKDITLELFIGIKDM